MLCPYPGCSEEIKPEYTSCVKCESPIVFCKHCKAPNRAMSVYCRQCGRPILYTHQWSCYRGSEDLVSSVSYNFPIKDSYHIKWHLSLKQSIRAPLIYYKAFLFACSLDGKLFIINTQANRTKHELVAEVSLGANEKVLFAPFVKDEKLFIPTLKSIYWIDLTLAFNQTQYIRSMVKAQTFFTLKGSDYFFTSHVNYFNNSLVVRATDSTGTKGGLYFIDTKSQEAKFLDFPVKITCPLVKNEVIYIGDSSGLLYKIGTDYKLFTLDKIQIPQGIDVEKSPTVIKDKVIYVNNQGKLYGYYYQTDDRVSHIGSAGSKAITAFAANQEKIVVGDNNGVDIYDLYGILKFSINEKLALADPVTTDPIVTKNSIIYGGQRGILYIASLHNPNHFRKVMIGRTPIVSNPAIHNDMVFVSDQNGEIKCIQAV